VVNGVSNGDYDVKCAALCGHDGACIR